MDDADRADSDIELLLKYQIAAIKPVPGRQPNGQCFNCEAPLDEGFKYCDNLCREDHEHRMRRIKHA